MPQHLSALEQIIESEYGGGFESQTLSFSTGTASLEVVPNNPNCVETVIVNTGAYDIFVSPVSPASAASGIFLHANGGSLALTVRDDLTLAGHEWYAVSPDGASSLFVVRVSRYQAPE